MARPEQHNCLFCGELFRADPRNARHQKYCSATGLPQSEQGGESARLAGQGGQPGLLPWTRECGAGAAVARCPPGVLAPSEGRKATEAGGARCVTRSLPRASN